MSGNMHVNARSQGCPAECWIVIIFNLQSSLLLSLVLMMWLQGVPICLHIGTQSQHVVLDPLMLSRNRGENMQTSLLSLKPIHGSHVHLLCSLWMRTHCRLFHSDWNYIGIGLLHRNTHIKHRKTHMLPVTLHFLAKGTLSKSRVAPVIGIGDLAPCRGFFLRCVKQ